MPYTPSLEEVIRLGVSAGIGELSAPMPGRIVRIDHANNAVDIQAMTRIPVDAIDDDGSDAGIANEELPIIPSVPILWPRSTASSITWPLAVGDTGLLLVLHYSASGWLDSGKLSDPGDVRAMHISNTVFLPGFCPKAQKPASAAVNALVLDGPEIHLGAAAALIARADRVATKLNEVIAAINGAQYHPGPGALAPLLTTPIGSISAADVGTDKVKGT